MNPDNDDGYITRRDFDAYRKMSWFRVAFGSFIAVVVTYVLDRI